MAIEEAETDAAAMAIEELKRRRFVAFVECVGSVGLFFFFGLRRYKMMMQF